MGIHYHQEHAVKEWFFKFKMAAWAGLSSQFNFLVDTRPPDITGSGFHLHDSHMAPVLLLLFPTLVSLTVILSHLCAERRVRVQDHGCMAILYWSFHSLEPRQDFTVFLTLSTVTVSGLNCTPTGSTSSSFLFQM